MTRIISGAAKGRRLVVPNSGVRPTSDRVRESVFNTLGSMISEWSGERVLDLFAGTGALGLEALSRGAESATFVERDRHVASNLRRNVAEVGLGGDVAVADAFKLPARQFDPGFTLVFADPPYALSGEVIRQAVVAWMAAGWIHCDAIVVLEGPKAWLPWEWPSNWQSLGSKRYGDTQVWYGSPEAREE